MDLERGEAVKLEDLTLDQIDAYVADALASTGTRRAAPPTRLPTPDPDPEIEIEIDFEVDDDQTEPFLEPFHEPLWSNVSVIDECNADAALLAQVTQQLAHGETAIAPLPRSRAPRSTVDLDDEVTNIVSKPV